MKPKAIHFAFALGLVLGCDANRSKDRASPLVPTTEPGMQSATAEGINQTTEQDVALIRVEVPSPHALRGGWAALAAVCASRGWSDTVYADKNQWYYHDGGGNWACIRFQDATRAIMIGHDHDYSETYFRKAASYFEKEETDLLAGAPNWWSVNLDPKPFGEWIGFIYGWDGQRWQRAAYSKPDGFDQVGLIRACSIHDTTELADYAAEAPGLQGQAPGKEALAALVVADGKITAELLQAVVPGWNIQAGVEAGRKFLDAEIQ